MGMDRRWSTENITTIVIAIAAADSMAIVVVVPRIWLSLAMGCIEHPVSGNSVIVSDGSLGLVDKIGGVRLTPGRGQTVL